MTLTELSYYSRKALPFVAIFCVVFLILFYIVKLLFIYLGSQNTVSDYTNTVFGPLKIPELKEASPSSGFNFTLDTVEGEPVTATNTAQIFLLPPSAARFGYRDKIYLMANTFGFDTSVIKHKLVDKTATFIDNQQSLDIDISNFNFSYAYKYQGKSDLFANATVPAEDVAQNIATDFLKSVNRYPDELAKGKLNTIYLHYDPQADSLVVTKRPQEANIVEIDLYRPDVDAVPQPLPIVSPKYFKSQNYVIMVFHGKDFKILKAQVRFFEKSDEQVGIYPLKTGNSAWDQLKNGEGLVILTPVKQGNITIKKMFLGYLDPDVYQDYLQPVYVFLGDSFVSYVPAVQDSFLSK